MLSTLAMFYTHGAHIPIFRTATAYPFIACAGTRFNIEHAIREGPSPSRNLDDGRLYLLLRLELYQKISSAESANKSLIVVAIYRNIVELSMAFRKGLKFVLLFMFSVSTISATVPTQTLELLPSLESSTALVNGSIITNLTDITPLK